MGKNTQVKILMGSINDWEYLEGAAKVLEEFGVSYSKHVASAHRTPVKVQEIIHSASEEGTQVFIAAAGYAAHLAGVIAGHTLLPVIGVPLDSSPLAGLDSLLSTAQMPSGVPVATVTIGKAGAKNAAVLAVQILALQDNVLKEKLKEYREQMRHKIESDDKQLNLS